MFYTHKEISWENIAKKWAALWSYGGAKKIVKTSLAWPFHRKKQRGLLLRIYKIIEKERKPAVRWKRRRSRKKGLKFHPFPPQCLPRWTWKAIMCVACRAETHQQTILCVTKKPCNAPLWHNKRDAARRILCWCFNGITFLTRFDRWNFQATNWLFEHSCTKTEMW